MTETDASKSFDGPQSGSLIVIGELAETVGVEPHELQPPLYDVIDPEILDRLVRRDGDATDASVSFTYREFTVVVRSDGYVSVES
ncbi:HalOD1 output domain-containing protein [Haladaptatus caseinilyticus]|uniref:HalOD1 output domain-containing protein n=1 Tax=Haladaptatus caseinilyticus TaxID=2993314 RepID=UPI00224B0BC9|nr:HalOD1 output domain-containing protein [Haladaptatus caseinilyticus]